MSELEFFFFFRFFKFLNFCFILCLFFVIQRDILINKKWHVRENMNKQGEV